MNSPSDLPPLAKDDPIGAKAHHINQCNQIALQRLFTVMRSIQDCAIALDDDKIDQSETLDTVAYFVIRGTISYLVTQLLTCRTLGQHDEEERIDRLIGDLYEFADKLDSID